MPFKNSGRVSCLVHVFVEKPSQPVITDDWTRTLAWHWTSLPTHALLKALVRPAFLVMTDKLAEHILVV